jgi:hypothetical protein
VLLESQVVAVVPVPFPVTATAMNFPLKALVTARVDLVAFEIFLQDFGIVEVALFTCEVQEYHW